MKKSFKIFSTFVLLNALSSVALAGIEQDRQSCVEAHNQLSFYKGYGDAICVYQERVQRVNNPDYSDCVQKMLAKQNGVQLAPFCLYFPTKDITPQVESCLEKSLQTVKPWFWHNEDMVQLVTVQNEEKSILGPFGALFPTHNTRYKFKVPFFMQRFMKDCQAPLNLVDEAAANPAVRVISESILHTYTNVPGQNYLLGGLSGLTIRNNQLYSITDDKFHPMVFRWDLEMKQDVPVLKNLSSIPIKIDTAIGNDFEDLTFTRSGHLLISSEPGQAVGMVNPLATPHFIFDLKMNTNKIVPFPTPDNFVPSSRLVEIPCPAKVVFPENNNDDDGFLAFLFGNGHGRPKADRPNQKCTAMVSTGLRYNKGIEGMAADLETNKLFYSLEQPLADAPDSYLTSIYQVDLDLKDHGRPEAIYKYPLNIDPDNGISALTVIDAKTLLVMERGFDRKAVEAIVKIYKVHLPDDPNEILQKELVVDFTTLRSQLTPGFRTIENFEGIVLGPDLSTGEQSLFLISDNNFNLTQKTEILVLALKVR